MRKSHEERKEEIIQATLNLAADDKTKKLTTQGIADEIGISQPTIFKHFKSSDKLFTAVFDWVAANIFKSIDIVLLNKADTADQRLQKLITAQLNFISAHPGIPRLIFSNQVSHGSPKFKVVVQTIMDLYTQKVSGLIIEGMASGEYRPNLNTQDTAQLITTTIQGLLIRWSIHDFDFELQPEATRLLNIIRAAIDIKSE
jgi:AcrR family transcriptional regulator